MERGLPNMTSEKADVKSHFPSDMRSSETADLFMVLKMNCNMWDAVPQIQIDIKR